MSRGCRHFELYLNDDDCSTIKVDVPTKIVGFDDFVDEDIVVGYAYREGYINNEDLDCLDYVEEVSREGHFDIANSYR